MFINHEQARVVLKRDKEIPPEVEREDKLIRWADCVYNNTMLITAASVLAEQGSLDKVASILWWAGFVVPPRYFPERHEGEDLDPDEEAALRLWVEGEAERIEEAIQTAGFYLAVTGKLMHDTAAFMPSSEPPARGAGLRAVPDNT